MNRCAGWLAIGALLSAHPALGQAPEDAPESADANTIVVTGQTQPPPRREVYDQALELSRVAPGQMYEEALARLTAPLCARVVGLDDDLSAEIIARIRANAQRVDVRLARGRCDANLLVAFVDNGQSLLDELARRHSRIFALVSAEERAELLAHEQPVRVWNVGETKRSSGAPLQYRRGQPVAPSVRGSADRLFLPTRKDINFALVVFDREAVVGMTTVQLADYATMRGLSHTRPASGEQAMNTILALFDDSTGLAPEEREPAELTHFDIGYLRSVYFWRPDRSEPAVGRLLSVRRRANAAMDEQPAD